MQLQIATKLFIYLDYPKTVVISCRKAIKYMFLLLLCILSYVTIHYDQLNVQNIVELQDSFMNVAEI